MLYRELRKKQCSGMKEIVMSKTPLSRNPGGATRSKSAPSQILTFTTNITSHVEQGFELARNTNCVRLKDCDRHARSIMSMCLSASNESSKGVLPHLETLCSEPETSQNLHCKWASITYCQHATGVIEKPPSLGVRYLFPRPYSCSPSADAGEGGLVGAQVFAKGKYE